MGPPRALAETGCEHDVLSLSALQNLFKPAITSRVENAL